jgi:hypothetical protein
VSVPVKRQPSRVAEDSLYNTTSPPQEAKRQREDSVVISEAEILPGEGEGDSLSEKRRKILRKGDWVGMSIQRPLQLAFASPRKEKNIGRRRNIRDGHRARYSSNQLHITSPFPTRRRLLANQSSSQEGPQRREPPRTDVRISIGGRVVPPGVSSSSAGRRVGSRSTTLCRRSLTTSSDVMLLDTKALVTHVSPRMATSNSAAPMKYSVRGYRSDNPDSSPADASLGQEVEQGNHIPCEAEDVRNGWPAEASEALSEFQKKDQEVASYEGNFESNSESCITGRTPKSTKETIQSGRLIFSSSTASIHQPAPRSLKVSSLLRSSSSDIAESTMAQVGKDKPIVPSSQVLENEIWETWIAPEQKYDRFSDDPDLNDFEKAQRVSISPGVSTYHAPWRPDSVEDDSEDQRVRELQGPRSESATAFEQSGVPISRTSNAQTQSSPAPLQIESENVDYRVEEENDKSLPPLERKLPRVVASDPPNHPLLEEDQNESWKKFLFGGIGDVLNDEVPTSDCNAVASQNSVRFGTSIIGQASENGSAVPTLNTGLHDTHTACAPSSISGGTSRITEVRPCPTGSTYPESRFNLASTVDFPSRECGISVQAEKGSVLASSSDSIQGSMAIQPMSQYSGSNMVETASSYRPHRKVTFTRPRPFIGQRANLEFVDQSRSLHIGIGLIDGSENSGSGRTRKRDVRFIVGSDEQDEEEDVESIEND